MKAHREKNGRPDVRSAVARSRSGRIAAAVSAVLALLFVSGVFAAPLLEAANVTAGGLLRLAYSPLCHQIPARSLELAGHSTAVCARCAGLYVGGLAGLVIGAVLGVGSRRGPRPAWLALAAAPTLADALLAWFGIGGLSNGPRLVLALPPGLLAGVFLSIGIHDLFVSRRQTDLCEPEGTPPALEGLDG